MPLDMWLDTEVGPAAGYAIDHLKAKKTKQTKSRANRRRTKNEELAWLPMLKADAFRLPLAAAPPYLCRLGFRHLWPIAKCRNEHATEDRAPKVFIENGPPWPSRSLPNRF